jgi:hypothetical protein
MSKPAQLSGVLAYGRDTPVRKVPSLAVQRRQVEAWALRARAKIARWFVDSVDPGQIEERPALMSALSALGQESSVLCIARPGALHHDPTVRMLVDHVAKRAGGTVVYANAAGESQACPLELGRLLDAHERMLLRLQLRAEEMKTPRGAVWGRVPWGFRLSVDGMSLEPNPTERAVVAVARHLRLRGLKLRQIADELKKLGVVSRTGKPLGITRIYELLDEGRGSRATVLADHVVADADAPPESVVRPSLRSGALSERAALSTLLVAFGVPVAGNGPRKRVRGRPRE